jgi:type II secretory ATPase GspE/PulE/Tfp pilus assembly ATPase PilB-like protein
VSEPIDEPIYESVGCDECHGTGYSGRIALMEMCPFDAELADLVARNAPVGEMRKIAEREGVFSLYQEGLRQVVAGLTTFDEVKCVSYSASI